MFNTLKEIGQKFRLPGEIYSYRPITMGNINSTFRATYMNEDKTLKSYLFQKINTHVFKSPVEIMENIDKVTTFIREKYPNQITLHFHHTDEGLNYYICDEDSFWRVVNYVESVTFDNTEDLKVIESTGKAFGEFQTQLSDFDGALLYETIPDFHNTKKRLDTLFGHAEEDPCNRVESVKAELDYIASVREKAAELSVMFANGEIPKRVTHNDTKCNNVLFDKKTKEPIVVIDLDTIMPGSVLFDFGDAIRFGASSAAEDETDLSKVYMREEAFDAFAKGFVTGLEGSLSEDEIMELPMGALVITLENGIRFLTDYLNCDTYFRIHYPQHNLDRARNQFALVRDMENKMPRMREIVKKYI
jgi:hypothetical protein